jgi:hypothetical protein
LDDFDLNHNDCPLAEKCPYYSDYKNGAGGCPAEGCPHHKVKVSAGKVTRSVSIGGDAAKTPAAKAKATTQPVEGNNEL